MHAVFVEVNATESNVEAAREFLPKVAVPSAREHGAKSGYWLAPHDGRGVTIVVFDTEAESTRGGGHVPGRTGTHAERAARCHCKDRRGTRGARRVVGGP